MNLGQYELSGKRPLHENHSTVRAPSYTGPIAGGGRNPKFHERDGIGEKTVRDLSKGAVYCAVVAAPIEIAPSVLAADAARLGEECMAIEKAGADRVHWDVMDGVFVPNLTFGPDIVAACRPHVDLHFEAHLMVVNPDELAPLYVKAGCDTVLIHVETCPHLHRSLGAIRDLGARPGVVVNPHTPASSIASVIDMVDEVLVMTVNPGFGGQKYITSMEPKIAEIRRMIRDAGLDVDLEVDGGITADTVAGVVTAGADVIVAGSAVFGHPKGVELAIEELRSTAYAAVEG